MFPKGFFAKGVSAGIKKKNGKKDMAVFYSEFPCRAAGMFTSNVVKAAPVLVSKKHLKSGSENIRAVVVNSGCANACTGKKGFEDAVFSCQTFGGLAGINPHSVLVASTGVIGQFLPMDKIIPGIQKLYFEVLNGKSDEVSAAEAIMTTDTKLKIASQKMSLPSFVHRRSSFVPAVLWGCCKGAGMIHPNLETLHATMLSFVLTDANIEGKALESALKEAVEDSFNCVSVDGDTSTNDTVVVLANAQAKNKLIKTGSKEYEVFKESLKKVCLELAKKIAADGEGATKLVEITVKNAKTKQDAKKIAATIATSPLFKTAVFGNDANWGRVLAAAGRSGIRFDTYRTSAYIGGVLVEKNGMAVNFSESKALKALKQKEVKVVLDMGCGLESAVYYTCDLTFGYIKENASYRS